MCVKVIFYATKLNDAITTITNCIGQILVAFRIRAGGNRALDSFEEQSLASQCWSCCSNVGPIYHTCRWSSQGCAQTKDWTNYHFPKMCFGITLTRSSIDLSILILHKDKEYGDDLAKGGE